MGKLTVIEIRALTVPGRYTDGDGLHLHVRSAKLRPADGESDPRIVIRRAWVFRYMRQGKVRDMGLGAFPKTTLAQARQKALEARKSIEGGADPLVTRDGAAKATEVAATRTFKRAAEDLMAARNSGWRNKLHRWQWEQTLAAYAYPVFGDWAVQAVDTEAVLRALQPIWNTKPETASRLRGRIEAVLDAAKARHWRTGENPARWKGHLAILLPNPAKVRKVGHMPSLPWQRLSEFMPALLAQTAIATAPLHLLILTAARAGMVRSMTWSEVDLKEKLWTIPGPRVTGGFEHRVPLSTAAIDLLEVAAADRARRIAARVMRSAPAHDLAFPGASGKPLSDMTLTQLLRRMNKVAEGELPPWRDGQTGEPITPHGFRSTFRVWASEQTAYPREIIEAAMAHAVADKVEAAYRCRGSAAFDCGPDCIAHASPARRAASGHAGTLGRSGRRRPTAPPPG
jgi:integrase